MTGGVGSDNFVAMRARPLATRSRLPVLRVSGPIPWTLLLFTAAWGTAPAAEAPPRPRPSAEQERANEPKIVMDPRVARLGIDLTLDPEHGLIRETASVTIEGHGLSTVTFRLQEGLLVERCRAGSGVAEHRKVGTEVHVDVDPAIDGQRTLTFEIRGRPRRGARDLVTGDHAALGGSDDWYPTFPATWAVAEVTVHAPSGWTAVAPGSRDAKAPAGTWRWSSATPVRSLAVGAASGLVLGRASVAGVEYRIAAPEGGVDADAVAARLTDGMSWLSGALAPYPFDGFNVVLLPGLKDRFRGSGLVVVPSDAPLATASDGADLLAGQWFGERIAGDGAWTEAFAAWEAIVFARDRALPLPTETSRLREAYLAGSVRDVPLSTAGWDAPAEVLRGKGSAAPDMVRLVIGDRRCFDAERDLFAAPVGPPISLRDLRQVFEKRAGRNLVRPFGDWFERSGVPEFEATLHVVPSSTGGWRADLKLRQRRGIYELPVEVVFRSAAEEHRETVQVDDEVTTPFYVLPFEPVRVEIDPLDRIFKWPTVGELATR